MAGQLSSGVLERAWIAPPLSGLMLRPFHLRPWLQRPFSSVLAWWYRQPLTRAPTASTSSVSPAECLGAMSLYAADGQFGLLTDGHEHQPVYHCSRHARSFRSGR